jgi:hypothetical protein
MLGRHLTWKGGKTTVNLKALVSCFLQMEDSLSASVQGENVTEIFNQTKMDFDETINDWTLLLKGSG